MGVRPEMSPAKAAGQGADSRVACVGASRTVPAPRVNLKGSFEVQLDTHKKMAAVLSKEQREQLRRQSAR